MKGYCEHCNDFVEYSIKKEEVVEEIKGTKIKYIEKKAYCKECGNWFIPMEIMDENLAEREKAYRKENDLITVKEIEEILEKYNIGKRPLSKVLGWGEVTLTKYIDGDIPTKQYSEELKRIKANPKYFKEKIERNREELTERAYKKVTEAVDNNIDMVGTSINESYDKIDSVVKYILKTGEEITPLALQKMLYIVQGFYKAFKGKYMFKENCQAWQHGPVYKDIYLIYKNYGYNPIEEENLSYGKINLTESEKEIIDSVLNYFGRYSGRVLEKITHKERPWRETRKGLRDDESSDRIIPKSLIGSYFKDVKEKYNMLTPADIKDYSEDMYHKLYS